MTSSFNKVVAWLKNTAISIWESAEFIELPSKSEWKDLTNFKEIVSRPLQEHFEAVGGILGIGISSVLRYTVLLSFIVSAWVVIQVATVYKLATYWKKS